MIDGPGLALEFNLDGRPRKMLFLHRFVLIVKYEVAGNLPLTLERPVQIALFLVVFEELRGHDNHPRVRLPNHLPKVRYRVFFWALSADVLFLHFSVL